MPRLRWFLVIFVGSLAVFTTIEADTVRLKNGNTLSGTVVEEASDGQVTIDIPGIGKITGSKNEIASIERASSGSTTPLNPASRDTLLQGDIVLQGDETNAAFWYQQAFSISQEPSPAIRAELTEILAKGWNGEHPALADFLKQNSAALILLARGAQLAHCDFYNGQPPRTIGSMPYSVLKVHMLTQALVLQGRHDEQAGLGAKALERYLLTLQFGHHLSQQSGSSIVETMVGIAVRAIAYEPLVQLVQRSSLKVEDYQKALKELLMLKTEEVQLNRAVEIDFSQSHNTLAESLQQEVKAGKAEALRAEQILEAFDRLTKEYMGYFAEAYHQHTPELFTQKFDILQQQVKQDVAATGRTMPEDVLHLFMKEDVVSSKDITPELIAKMFLSNGLSDLSKGMQNCWVGRARINLLTGAMGIRLYELEHGAAPQKLDELVPAYLPAVPDDPFDGAPLRYVNEKGTWRLYSIGPDRKDQQGKQILPVTLQGPGDMVLSSS